MIRIRLIEWALRFIRNKDLIIRNIVNILEKENHFIVEYKNKKCVYLVEPNITNISEILKKFKGFDDLHPAIITLNTKSNVDVTLSEWDNIVKFNRFLSITFANPDSLTETKWIIFPHTHTLITDDESLKPGIKAMSETVDFVSEANIDDYR